MTGHQPAICFVALSAYPLLAADSATPFIGGAELQQVIVARGLVERGYPVSMICLDFGQRDEEEIDGIRVIRSYRPDAGVPVLRFVWPRLTQVWQALARADAAIYYQRTASMLTGVVAEFCKRHDRKSVFAAAGDPDLELRTPRIRYARDRWIYGHGLRNVDRIVVQNDEQMRLCRQHLDRDSVRIPNCYPTPRGPRTGRAENVLWVSTIRSLKQPGLFLDLAEKLPAHRFRMIGGPARGEEKLYEKIRARAERIDNLEFLGFLPFAETEAQFDHASVFVNTSESEGFPNTFLQSWAREIPTLSFIDCGARHEGKTVGRQVDGIERMTQQLATWLADPAQRARDGAACRKYYEQQHAPTLILDRYEQLFRELSDDAA